MPRIGIINSYNFPGLPGHRTRRIRRFLEALDSKGWRLDRDYGVELCDAEETRDAQDAALRLVDDGVDLIHAVGTPNAVAASEATAARGREIPVVYYGAHPEGIGDEACSAPNVTGQIQALPLSGGYKEFRLLRRLVPRARTVYVPFFEGTVFVQPRMRELHASRRNEAGEPVWLAGEAGEVGFQTLSGLCYIIGLEYREMVYRSSRELEAALGLLEPATGLVMCYNETFYCPGAVETAVRVTGERGLPLLWNNNAHVAALGALAGIGADFEEAGRVAGEMAAAILSGTPPSELPRIHVPEQIAWINLEVAARLGLETGNGLMDYFDRRLAETDHDTGA